MLKKIKMIVAVVALAFSIVNVLPTYADTPCPDGSARAVYKKSLSECNLDPGTDENTIWGTVNNLINVALGIIGVVAVIMIIIAGFQYATANGDTTKITKAKNTLMYSIIGLIIALLAFAIVNFVLTNVF